MTSRQDNTKTAAGISVPVSARQLTWLTEPTMEASSVLTFLDQLQVVAPNVWADLIKKAAATRSESDLAQAVHNWATEKSLCGRTGPTEWALLVGLATAKSMYAVSWIDTTTTDDTTATLILSRAAHPATVHHIRTAARRLLVTVEVAKAMFTGAGASAPPLPLAPPTTEDIRGVRFLRWGLTLYRRRIRDRCAAFIGQSGTPRRRGPVEITVAAKTLTWSQDTDPSAATLMDTIYQETYEEVRQQLYAAINPSARGGRSVNATTTTQFFVWLIRYQILGHSLTRISQTPNSFLEHDRPNSPTTHDRATVLRHIRDVAERLGIVLRPMSAGGRPHGRKDSRQRFRPPNNR
jgi:hypothetical protein